MNKQKKKVKKERAENKKLESKDTISRSYKAESWLLKRPIKQTSVEIKKERGRERESKATNNIRIRKKENNSRFNKYFNNI